MTFFGNMCESMKENSKENSKIKEYYKKVRNYAVYLFSQIEGLSFTDKDMKYRGQIGLNLWYRGQGFSLVWECPFYYLDHFAEIMGGENSAERLELEEFPNITKILDRYF